LIMKVQTIDSATIKSNASCTAQNLSPAITTGDIYYNHAYGKLYDDIEKGEYKKFEYSFALGSVAYPFIKRPVNWLIDGKQYYDIVTPYGYGGPLITGLNECGDAAVQELMSAFGAAFSAYCKANDIICEFIRFHTLFDNALYCREMYDVIYNRHTIAIDLTDQTFFETQFDSKCRNMVRKAEKNGVSIDIDRELKSIDTFADIYYSTMAKNAADDYYFFKIDYFHRIRDKLAGEAMLVNAVYEGQTVSSSLFFYTPGGFAHYHLSATKSESYKLAANNLILKAACDALREKSCTWFHLGGGLSAASDDRLFAFKHSFGHEVKNIRDFYIGKKVWNERVYKMTVEQYLSAGGEIDTFFPLYRG
jgi:serine/alanine adding enzyme